MIYDHNHYRRWWNRAQVREYQIATRCGLRRHFVPHFRNTWAAYNLARASLTPTGRQQHDAMPALQRFPDVTPEAVAVINAARRALQGVAFQVAERIFRNTPATPATPATTAPDDRRMQPQQTPDEILAGLKAAIAKLNSVDRKAYATGGPIKASQPYPVGEREGVTFFHPLPPPPVWATDEHRRFSVIFPKPEPGILRKPDGGWPVITVNVDRPSVAWVAPSPAEIMEDLAHAGGYDVVLVEGVPQLVEPASDTVAKREGETGPVMLGGRRAGKTWGRIAALIEKYGESLRFAESQGRTDEVEKYKKLLRILQEMAVTLR